ncbi:MAG: hypothetical protein ACE14T_06960 [Syntrophales bacterium]
MRKIKKRALEWLKQPFNTWGVLALGGAVFLPLAFVRVWWTYNSTSTYLAKYAGDLKGSYGNTAGAFLIFIPLLVMGAVYLDRLKKNRMNIRRPLLILAAVGLIVGGFATVCGIIDVSEDSRAVRSLSTDSLVREQIAVLKADLSIYYGDAARIPPDILEKKIAEIRERAAALEKKPLAVTSSAYPGPGAVIIVFSYSAMMWILRKKNP